MGQIGSLFGSGSSGAQQANITTAATKEQADQQYAQAQAALAQQNALVAALQGQNGIGNQSQVYNQLQGVVNGTGANPAQAMLAQSTGANTANQVALMAGQRGASQNVGLIARQAAQQGAANQQNAVGQAATLQANQSLNALNVAGGVAGQQVANQIGQTNAYGNAVQSEQGQILGSIANQNAALTSSQNNVNQQTMAAQGKAADFQTNTFGNLTSAAGTAAGMPGGGAAKKAHGGEITQGPRSKVGQHLSGKVDAILSPGEIYLSPEEAAKVAAGKESPMQGSRVPGEAKVKGDSLKNDVVPAKLEEGGMVIPRSHSMDPKKAQAFVAAHFKRKGLSNG